MSEYEKTDAGGAEVREAAPQEARTADAGAVEQVLKMHEIMEAAEAVMLTTISGEELISRPMKLLKAEEDGTLWFLTARQAAASDDTARDPRVNISFTGKGYLSVSGTAQRVEDPEVRQRLWNKWAENYFETTWDDEKLMLLRVTVTSAQHWDKPGRFRSLLTAIANRMEEEGEPERAPTLRGM